MEIPLSAATNSNSTPWVPAYLLIVDIYSKFSPSQCNKFYDQQIIPNNQMGQQAVFMAPMRDW